jgi:hypothetical protein
MTQPHPDDVARVVALAGAGALVGPGAALIQADAFGWLEALPDRSIHAVVTDPPYGWLEYERTDHDKLRAGRGGVWRIPPTLDGVKRGPVPRFTVLSAAHRSALRQAMCRLAQQLARVLVPGGHAVVASNPLLSTIAFEGLSDSPLEKRGEIVRLVQTLRGGDRPKGAHEEFADVTVMPRSGWEPWGLFRAPLDGTVAQTLRRWHTGGLRRSGPEQPFRDVIRSAPTHKRERAVAAHPSLKPAAFMRTLVRGILPLGRGVILDPFAGSGSTVAAAAHHGLAAIGIERDPAYHQLARDAFAGLRDLEVNAPR